MTELDPKERIIEATRTLLEEGADPAAITVRQIAKRAEVGVGLINYHFGSKDKLLNEAVGAVMMVEAQQWFDPAAMGEGDAVTRLRNLLKRTSNIAVRFPKMTQHILQQELLNGEFSTALLIVPLLRETYSDAKDEFELRVVAIMLITSLQAISLRMDVFHRLTGIDLLDGDQRDRAIDLMIDTVLNQ